MLSRRGIGRTLVVADAAVDPFIYSNGKILFAEHGTGKWAPCTLFDNIYDMAWALATIGLVVQNAGTELTDDDFNIKPRYRDRAVSELSKSLDSTIARLTISSLGWDDAG